MTEPLPDQAAVDRAITSRRSIRGYRPDLVPAEVVRDILAVASRAPSMTNTQPWRVHVLMGAARDALCREIVAAHAAGEHPEPDYDYYPREWLSPYLDRRRRIGWALYGLLGIAKGDREATARQHRRNYDFFGAPVGMIVTLHRSLGAGSYLDLGMFLQNVMVAARARGLDTCAQAAFMNWHGIIRRHLPIPPEEIVICGMALGHADPAAPANALVSPREPVEAFCTFHGAPGGTAGRQP
ncbi:nitroreductase [Paracraurococcus lichenis]|uniref:Nitroreductase n=1 Tax=Paracraurococcus lichenis TaxID=3064888 RepID=A0ABT9DW12_9PROT|nr:nitroreductase [Paracraurococcus sp. LOR1-02]MDO9708091.1 nitroreductase [Paracraurococcus sp. LOR1-02]